MKPLQFTVPADRDGVTVQAFLRGDCGLSWRLVVKLKRVPEGITADGCPVRTIDRLKAGQRVVLSFPPDILRVEPAPMPLSILYEDDSLLVIDKPAGLPVHPSAGKPGPTLAAGVVAYFQNKGEPASFRPVSRLDRQTSGLLLAAKNSHIAHVMAQKTQKTYLALACGRLEGEGLIDQPIRVKEGCCITRAVGEGGKESRTHWTALATDGTLTLLRLWLETGRTHQIRVHMAWLGYPLMGDTMYGEDDTFPRHALHCATLAFDHPLTGHPQTFAAPLPDDMAAVVRERGWTI